MALQAYAEGRYEDAMQRFSDLLYEDPRNPRLHIWLGASFRKAGKLEYAKVQYQQVLTLTTDADLVSLARSSLAQIQQQTILAGARRDQDDSDPMATTLQAHGTGYKVRRHKSDVHGDSTDGADATMANKATVNKATETQGGNIPAPLVRGQAADKRRHKSNGTNGTAHGVNHGSQVSLDTPEGGRIPPPPGLVPIPPLPPLAVRVKPSALNGNGDQHNSNEHGTAGTTAPQSAGVSVAKAQAGNGRVTHEQTHDDGLGAIKSEPDSKAVQDSSRGQEQASVADQNHDHGLVASVAKRWGKLGKSRAENVTQPLPEESHNNSAPAQGALETKRTKGAAGHDAGISLAELISRTAPTEGNYAQNGSEAQSGSRRRLALEDVINFASLKSKATLWAAVLATVPVVGVGVMTYQMGDRIVRQQVRQTYLQNSRNISSQVQQFWQEQVTQTKITAQLLAGDATNNTTGTKSSVVKRNVAAAVVNSRLRLYHQANPEFDDLFVVQTDGEILGRADAKPSPVIKGTVLMLEPGVLEQVSQSRRPMMVMLPKMPLAAVIVPVGINVIPNVIPTVSDGTAKPPEKPIDKSALVVATVPLDAMQKRVGSLEPAGIYIADGQGRTLINQPIKGYAPLVFGSAVSNSFPLAGILQTSGQTLGTTFQDDVSLGDRSQGLMAYTPLPLQVGDGKTPDLTWGVFLVGERDYRSTGVMVLAILVAIGATPVLVALLAFVLTHQVTSRINHIRYRVMSVAQTTLEDLMRKQTLLIDEAELLTKDSQHTKDELGTLSKSINDMVEQFQTMLRKQHRQKQQLQNQVLKLVNELSELAEVPAQEALPQDSDIDQLMQSLKTKLKSQKEQEEKYLAEQKLLQQQLTNLATELADIQPNHSETALVVHEAAWDQLPQFMNDALIQLKTVVNQVKQGATQMNQSLGHNELTLTQLVALIAQQAELAQHTVKSAHDLRQGDLNMIRNGQLVMNMSHQIHAETLQNDQAITELITTLQNMHQSMVQTANVVKGLGDSSQKVNRVLALLNELAVQINFIAINASLEGAKSGSHNNSLIMVAEEIGQMANRSAAIAKEVESIMEHLQTETTEVMQAVESSRDQVATGNNLLQNTQSTLQELSGLSQNIHELVSVITETTQFQSKTSESVANLLNNMNEIAHNTLKASEEAKHSLQSTMQVNERLQNIFQTNLDD